MNVRLNKNQRIQVVTARDIYAIMQQVLLRENKIRRNQEHFWVVGLDNQQKILFIELVALGAVNRVNANPPDVFRMGIYKLAVSIILVHNHPSGNLTPSTSDKQFTDKMLKVSELVNIKIVDHLIISETGFISLKEQGIIEDLKQSGIYEIMDPERKAIEEWRIREQQKRDSAIEIAKKMIKDGLDINSVKKYTGLKKSEIEKLSS